MYNYIHNANAETKANAKVMTKYLHFCILKKTCHLRLPTLSINIKHCFSTAQISTLQAHPGTLEPYTATQELSSVYPNLQDIANHSLHAFHRLLHCYNVYSLFHLLQQQHAPATDSNDHSCLMTDNQLAVRSSLAKALELLVLTLTLLTCMD